MEKAAAPAEQDAAKGKEPTAGSGQAGGASPQVLQGPHGLLALQRLAGNAAVGHLVRRPPPAGAGPRPAAVQRSLVIGPEAAHEAHDSRGGDRAGAEAPAAEPAGAPAPGGKAPAAPAGGGDADAGGGGEPAQPASTALTPETLDAGSAHLIADLAAQFGPGGAGEAGAPHPLLQPSLRHAAAQLVPERAADLGLPPAQRVVPSPPGVQRTAATLQRKGPTAGTARTKKVKVGVPGWQPIPLFQDRNVGSWFLLSGSVESPTWEGAAKPPDSIRDDTTEEELQLTADGKVAGYSATLHKETLAKVGQAELEGKVQVETTTKAVKVTGLTLNLPNLGGEGVLLQGQFDFDLLDWEPGKPPGVMVLSYTQKLGIESKFNRDGWKYTGQLYAPLAAGAVCVALWVNAIEAGRDFGTALGYATKNTKGYVVAFVGTIYDHPPRYDNEGAAQGKADAQAVLDKLRWSELPEGAKEQIREQYLEDGSLNVPAAQDAAWERFRAAALDWYRQNHSIDAWAYDHGLPSDLAKLGRIFDGAGPPWPISNY